MPDGPEAHGLLALMMIHHARRRARFSGEDLVLLDRLDLDGYLYFHSTRGELPRRLGRDEARAAYRRALELATSTPERRFLTGRLEQL
jgi:predicted RNA polymerase sigma factor